MLNKRKLLIIFGVVMLICLIFFVVFINRGSIAMKKTISTLKTKKADAVVLQWTNPDGVWQYSEENDEMIEKWMAAITEMQFTPKTYEPKYGSMGFSVSVSIENELVSVGVFSDGTISRSSLSYEAEISNYKELCDNYEWEQLIEKAEQQKVQIKVFGK